MFAVAIDGPTGAGKSSVAKSVAEKLGFLYVDTGALYRTIGLYLVQNKINPADVEKVCGALEKIDVDMKHTEHGQIVFLCGEDVTDQIRSPEVSDTASRASVISEVREFLRHIQIDIAAKNHVIMDGRDIGTVVLPDAQVKIFLTASPEERARRRWRQMEWGGMEADYETVLAELKERDHRDTHREIAPLMPAQEAVIVDSTGYEKKETVEIITKMITKALEKE